MFKFLEKLLKRIGINVDEGANEKQVPSQKDRPENRTSGTVPRTQNIGYYPQSVKTQVDPVKQTKPEGPNLTGKCVDDTKEKPSMQPPKESAFRWEDYQRPQISASGNSTTRPASTPSESVSVVPEIRKPAVISPSERKSVPSEERTRVEKPITRPIASESVETKTPSGNTGEQKPTVRRSVVPRVKKNDETAQRRLQKTSVYIGIDFGTTFTKAAYEIAPSNVHMKYSIQFGKENSDSDYYLPSVLYFDPVSCELMIEDETGSAETIRYFKFNLISDALQKNKVLNNPAIFTHTAKERLCCVFFLSYVISLIRKAVHENFGRTVINENTEWYINMGVPLEAHREDERAMLYKKVLELAFLFEREYSGVSKVDIHLLDEFYQAHVQESNSKMNILPEIYAEVLLYQQYLNTPAGFYTVVDIGGGTEDIATFLKTNDGFGEKVECLAQNVIGYGYDSISERIVNSITKTSVTKAKSFLKRKIDFNDDAYLQENVPKEINADSVLAARKECRTLFGSCVQRARKTRNEVLKQTVSAKLPMHVFVMGGARSVEFYRSSIEFMKRIQEMAGIPFFKDSDVFDYVGRNTRLEIRNDQRLVISQMLAQPFEMIPEIENMPWDLKEQDVTSKGMSWLELQARQNELYPE